MRFIVNRVNSFLSELQQIYRTRLDSRACGLIIGFMLNRRQLHGYAMCLKHSNSEHAHLPPRILSRPWSKDDFLKSVVSKMAHGRGSPAQIIQWSPTIRQQFSELLNERAGERRLGNLRAAKHRFESLQKPLGRSIRLLPCLHAMMVRLAVQRTDTVGSRAREWLEWLATPRHVLMAAMLADIADEAMMLTRFCDAEDMDVACVSSQILAFLARVTDLFGERARCLDTVGHTQSLID